MNFNSPTTFHPCGGQGTTSSEAGRSVIKCAGEAVGNSFLPMDNLRVTLIFIISSLARFFLSLSREPNDYNGNNSGHKTATAAAAAVEMTFFTIFNLELFFYSTRKYSSLVPLVFSPLVVSVWNKVDGRIIMMIFIDPGTRIRQSNRKICPKVAMSGPWKLFSSHSFDLEPNLAP